MDISFFIFAVVAVLLLNSHIKPSLAKTPLLNSTTDQNALLQFKNTITYPFDMSAKNWSGDTSVCNWIGVSCGIKHQRITSLNISGFGLRGTLPPHLGNLTFLRYLDISSNNLTGLIPSELSRLRRLKEMDVSFNAFTGELPSWLGALPQLEKLNLMNNTFSGRIPESLFNNSKLQIMSLHSNFLTGSIPENMFSNLPNLKLLSLSYNQLEGQIPPNIWKCRELEMLSLSFNRFSGKIPTEIGRLSMLKELYLGFNDFSKGGVPVEFGKLSQLELLNIRNASLIGFIPKQLGNCTSLKKLGLDNNFLTGELPQEFGDLASLEFLSALSNSLSGSIPPSIFNISTLRGLGLSFNQFTGNLHIPSKFSLSNLQWLHVASNKLSGEIPYSINNASKLTLLELANNSFTGSIPNFGHLRLLQVLRLWGNNLRGANSPDQELEFLSSLTNSPFLNELDISQNPLNGILPASIGNLSTISLRMFSTEHCNIKGVIPNTIGNLTGLEYLSLSGNQLTGSIPPTIGKLKHLQRLHLPDNQLQGYIPSNLCLLSNMFNLSLNENALTGPIPECLSEVKSLQFIYLHSNKLNSTIPSSFWNLRDLVFLNLSSNYFSGQIPSKIASLKMINQLDLSRNQFTGEIPGSIGECESLVFLSLSNNKFEQSIPPSLGNLRGLSMLDLSSNNLSGSIPESLEGLAFLHYFNVSNNKLEGDIPTSGPFMNFTARSFSNNSALCGATKFQVPPCISKHIRKSRLKIVKHILPPFLSVIIVATIVIFVLIKRRKRKRATVPVEIPVGTSWRRISYIELVKGTNDFNENTLLGRGSFGSVFKGTLSDGFNIAVKVFNMQSERSVRSFDTECEILSNIRHRNLVRIIGCCSNTQFKALIFVYMPNESLEKWLYSENYCMDLIQRLQIAIDVALALEYLHHGHTFPVVHCDVKPSNILLDEDMVAHLGDFGIAKLFDDGEIMAHTKTLATIGYVAPEYGSEGKVSTNGDVYSYGILLLELFTKKKPTDDMFSEEMSLKEWVNEALQENAVSEVVARDLLSRDDQYFRAKEECVASTFSLALKCLAVSPDERINMIETVATLKKIKAKVLTSTTRKRQHVLSINVGQ